MIDMMEDTANFISDGVMWGMDKLATKQGLMLIILVGSGLVAGHIWWTLPVMAASVGLGLLIGQAMRGLLQTSTFETRTETIDKIVPYDNWPDSCYACDNELGHVRGQLVIHKGEDTNQMKAVGLCENCTRTHSTMLDYSDRFAEIYDMRGEPEEL